MHAEKSVSYSVVNHGKQMLALKSLASMNTKGVGRIRLPRLLTTAKTLFRSEDRERSSGIRSAGFPLSNQIHITFQAANVWLRSFKKR